MNYNLRKATIEDFPAINSLFGEMMLSIYGKTDASYTESSMEHYFNGGEDQIILAESEYKIIGFLSMEAHREEESFVYFDDISVAASCRGQGIGSVLLDEGEKYAVSLGISTLVLHVEQHNIARHLYERKGFTQNGAVGTRLRMIKYLKV